MRRILITGGTGMVGRNLVDSFNQMNLDKSQVEIYTTGRVTNNNIPNVNYRCNLENQNEVVRMFEDINPTTVIHTAAKVGGIIANSSKMYDFFYKNLQINTNIIDWCAKNNRSLFTLSSTCVYPKNPPSYPMDETMIHSGEPEETNFGYAYAKRMMDVQLRSAESQLNYKNWFVLYCTNLYGKYDNFDSTGSHVIPALLKKFIVAKQTNLPHVTLHGDGTPLRQLTYAKDVSDFIAKFVLENPILPRDSYNFGNTHEYSICEIAKKIRDLVGYAGDIIWDRQLNGIRRKPITTLKLEKLLNKKFAYSDFTDLESGLEQTYNWVMNNSMTLIGTS